MGQKITVVDAFTEKPFSGNPAAVCALPAPRSDEWMQDVAREMNLSETAFLNRDRDDWALRWFTPQTEVELCGHATLASAHVLWEDELLPRDGTARFNTLSGRLTAARRHGWIELDFPATPASPTEPPDTLTAALGVRPVFVGKTKFDYLIELEGEDVVENLRPNIQGLGSLPSRGFIVTSRAKTGARKEDISYDFVSRFFAPAFGVAEDPVTGSAHCALGPFWGDRLGKTQLTGYQCSARGGIVGVRLEGDRVILGGRAVTVLRGELGAD
jgi:PhzF family phenazine biosynthesis protein